jgi:hypothetical protein
MERTIMALGTATTRFEDRYEAIKLPQLYVVIVRQLLGGVRRCIVIEARKVEGAHHMAVVIQQVRAIVRHREVPCGKLPYAPAEKA